MEISDRYLLEKRLGSQAKRKFGELFLGVDKRSGEKVVLKVVRLTENGENSAEILNAQRLRAEATFSFSVASLPKTICLEESNSSVILIREYCTGVPLDVYWKTLKRRDRLSFILSLLEKLAPIFNHLASAHIVHCDIKPSNLLIEAKEGGFELHLIDFGLAIRKTELAENRTRKLLFPLGYAAPELLLNELDLVDQRSDIFALGILIWRLYAGSLPLVHPNPSIFTNLQLTHPLPEHSEVPKKVYAILSKMSFKHQFALPPNRMDQVEVRACLTQAIEQRYSSLDQVIQEMGAISKKRFWW